MSGVEVFHVKTPRIEPFPQTDPGHTLNNPGSVLHNNHRCCCNTRCLLISAFLVIMALSVALIVLSIEVSSRSDSDDEDDFDEYFRTPEEQAEYERIAFALEANLSTTGFTLSPDRCSFQCSVQKEADESGRPSQTTARPSLVVPIRPTSIVIRNQTVPTNEVAGFLNGNASSVRTKRQAIDVSQYPPVRHACCVSEMLFITPSGAMNVFNKRRIVVQRKQSAQYFKSYSCRHAEGCTGCGCCQSVEHHRAVVRKPNKEKTFVDLIVLPGCCKCYNNLDPSNC